MCRSVGQTSHSILLLLTQLWWVPGRTRIGELWMTLAAENVCWILPRGDEIVWESSNTRGVNCEVCWAHGISDYKHTHLHLHLTTLSKQYKNRKVTPTHIQPVQVFRKSCKDLLRHDCHSLCSVTQCVLVLFPLSPLTGLGTSTVFICH